MPSPVQVPSIASARITRRSLAASTSLISSGLVRSISPVMAEPYERNRVTGAFVLVDELTRDTVAAGMVRTAKAADAGMEAELAWEAPPLEREERWDALATRGATVWLRATPELIAEAGAAVERALVSGGRSAYLIDGGVSQQGLPPGRLARLFADSGAVAVAALPAASAEVRREGASCTPPPTSPSSTSTSPTASVPSAPPNVRSRRWVREQRQQQHDHDQHEQDRAGRRGLPLVGPEARVRLLARVAALGRLADPVVVVGHQSNTLPIETRRHLAVADQEVGDDLTDGEAAGVAGAGAGDRLAAHAAHARLDRGLGRADPDARAPCGRRGPWSRPC